jgi:inorganic phosphate transporter, PiT family
MSLWPAIIVGATLFVAYANGANDNFKGVATLFGSGTTDYRKALWWATVTTFAGSVTALFLATELIATFQGKNLISGVFIQSPPFLAAVILGTAATVMLANKLGIPISTTHGLTGALFGAGIVAVGLQLGFQTFLTSFFVPLLVSPLLSVVLALLGYPILSRFAKASGLSNNSCFCIGSVPGKASAVTPSGVVILETTPGLRVIMDQQGACEQALSGTIFGVNGERVLDAAHYLSAAAVSFARGLNDTPKIVALGLVAAGLEMEGSIILIGLVMAMGGIIGARKVAETVSKRITAMDPEQGLAANLITSILVIFASKWGMPVSTTHVSCGALFGIGIANGQAQWKMIRTILAAWVLTLPTAALLSGVIYSLLRPL